jgi:hypothetical protein
MHAVAKNVHAHDLHEADRDDHSQDWRWGFKVHNSIGSRSYASAGGHIKVVHMCPDYSFPLVDVSHILPLLVRMRASTDAE